MLSSYLIWAILGASKSLPLFWCIFGVFLQLSTFTADGSLSSYPDAIGVAHSYLPCSQVPPSFPLLAVWKNGESLVSFLTRAWRNWKMGLEWTGCISHIVQSTAHSTLSVYDNRPPLAINPFLPSFLSWCHSREQALSCFSILKVTESWSPAGKKATLLL